jgi:L-threonylcarbamoyladenylate synthase
MVTRVLTIESTTLFREAVRGAVSELKRGGVVVLPTETVYGLAANAFSESAVQRIYEIKGRPAHNPIIVHVASIELAANCAAAWPEDALRLARKFWPGPLTLVLPKSSRIPGAVTAGGATVGIRWPAHPFIQEVIKACGFPLAAPSANRSNEVSSTTAGHVLQGLDGKVPLVIDAGPSSIGIESTVVDLSALPPRILRPGMIHSEELKKILPSLETFTSSPPGAALKSPGMLSKHYAPRARVVLASWQSDAQLREQASQWVVDLAGAHVIAYEHIPRGGSFGRVSVIPHDPEAYARALYAELHASDQGGAEIIIIEEPPATPEWEAIRDRLRRAAAP